MRAEHLSACLHWHIIPMKLGFKTAAVDGRTYMESSIHDISAITALENTKAVLCQIKPLKHDLPQLLGNPSISSKITWLMMVLPLAAKALKLDNRPVPTEDTIHRVLFYSFTASTAIFSGTPKRVTCTSAYQQQYNDWLYILIIRGHKITSNYMRCTSFGSE